MTVFWRLCGSLQLWSRTLIWIRLDPRRPHQVYGDGEAVLIGSQKGALLNEERLFGRFPCCSWLASLSGCSSLSAPRAPFASRSEITITLIALPSDQRSEGRSEIVPAACQMPAKFSSHRNLRSDLHVSSRSSFVHLIREQCMRLLTNPHVAHIRFRMHPSQKAS